jgi:Kef-type K+ transport system membrane component KefB/Trk K+ transport system NAD-binding subunit
MEENLSFVPLLIVVALAFVVPLVLSRFKRLRIPIVVGEIIVGIIIGRSGLHVVGEDPVLEVLGLLGFAYLMFLSGLEVDFEAILPRPGVFPESWRERLSNPMGLGILAFAATLILALLAGRGLHILDAADDPWLMALILSTTSLGLVMPVLKERGLTATAYGQTLLVASVIADFATMLLVSIYAVLITEGLSPEVMLVLILFGAFITFYRLARLANRRLPGLAVMRNLSQATTQLDVRGAFALGLAFIVLAQGVGAEMILGAFLGGALISLMSNKGSSDMRSKLESFGYAFFIPIFFIMVGVSFDLPALVSSPQALLLVPVILVLAYGIKFAAAQVFRLAYTPRETMAGGALLSSRLSLIIAVSAIGLQLGSIDAATNSAIILVAIVTSTVSPLLFNRLLPETRTPRRKFVIVGADRMAWHLARRIAEHDQDVVCVDCDEGHAAAAEEIGVPFVQGDALDPDIWTKLEPETVRAVAVLLSYDEANLEVCRLLREEYEIQRVVSYAHDAINAPLFSELDVQVINPTLSPVVELEYLLLYPSVSSLMTDLEDNHDISEIRLTCTELADRPLQDLDLPEGAMIVLVRRNGDVIYPRGQTRFQLGDRLTIMGSVDAVRELSRRCA